MFIIELYFIFSAYTPLSACHQSCHVTLFIHATQRSTENSSIASPLARCIQRSACRLRHRQNGGLDLGMFCKLPRTASSAHLSLLPASSFRHLDLLSLLLNRVTKRPVTGLTGKTQAVLSPSTVKRFLEANKLPHKEGHHAALTLTCPLWER